MYVTAPTDIICIPNDMPATFPVIVAFNRSGLNISPSNLVISIPIPMGVPPPVWSSTQWKELTVSNLSLAVLMTCAAVTDAAGVEVDLEQPIDTARVTARQRVKATNFDRLIILFLQNINEYYYLAEEQLSLEYIR